MGKTAVFGGTFDPIHNGHIAMARYAVEIMGFDKIIFLPNGNPPHKKDNFVTLAQHRYNMVKLAIDGCKEFTVSEYEASCDEYSYSLYTMRHFREKYGENVYFMIGADSLCTIHLWYEYRKFMNENKFIVFFRPSEADDVFTDCVDRYRREGVDIYVADMPKTDISATSVRQSLIRGEYDGLPINEKVLDYIIKNNLYGEKHDNR